MFCAKNCYVNCNEAFVLVAQIIVFVMIADHVLTSIAVVTITDDVLLFHRLIRR